MKAIEYYEKYHDSIMSTNEKCSLQAVSDFIVDLSHEVGILSQARKCRTNSSIIAVLKEVNEKYNAVMRIFKKKNGITPLIPNGFLEFWKRKEPSLSRFL